MCTVQKFTLHFLFFFFPSLSLFLSQAHAQSRTRADLLSLDSPVTFNANTPRCLQLSFISLAPKLFLFFFIKKELYRQKKKIKDQNGRCRSCKLFVHRFVLISFYLLARILPCLRAGAVRKGETAPFGGVGNIFSTTALADLTLRLIYQPSAW